MTFHSSRNGRQFSAWLGLVPRQHSSGGKARLGRITKRGDAYLRYLMVLGAKAAMRVAPKKDDEVSRWVCQLRERIGWQKACVALANKNARHVWALLAGRRVAQELPTRPGPLDDAAPARPMVRGARRRSRARSALAFCASLAIVGSVSVNAQAMPARTCPTPGIGA